MSSGYNGIPIKNVGVIRTKLAEMISQLTGTIVEPHHILRTNPHHRKWEDCCAWDCWGTKVGGNKIHIYSWDTMKNCVRSGITMAHDDQDIEISANGNPVTLKQKAQRCDA